MELFQALVLSHQNNTKCQDNNCGCVCHLYEPGALHGVAPAVVAGHGGVGQQEVRVERRAVGGQAVRARAGQRHLDASS